MKTKKSDITLAAKSRPEEKIFRDIHKAGLSAVELYLSRDLLAQAPRIIRLCRRFPFQYAVHAPNDSYAPEELLALTEGIGAEVLVLHNIYWDDEWRRIAQIFRESKARLCVENISGVNEPLKIIRRYGFGRCVDLEHMQMECCGVYEEEFIEYFKQAAHIHMTGYTSGSKLWHTHIHHSVRHSVYMLNLLDKAGYRGFVVSEAKVSLQTYAEFKKLNVFFRSWKSGKN